MKTSDSHISPSCPSRDARMRDIGDSMLYKLVYTDGYADPIAWSGLDLRLLAMSLQSNYQFCDDERSRRQHIDDIDLQFAISVLLEHGYKVCPA